MKTSFTRETVKLLRKEINKTLAPLSKKLGIEFDLGTIRFTPYEMRVKLTGTANKKEVASKKKEEDANNFKVFGRYSGLDPSDLGKTFTFNGNQFKVVGWNTKARKNAVKLQRLPDGKGFKCSVAQLKRFLNK